MAIGNKRSVCFHMEKSQDTLLRRKKDVLEFYLEELYIYMNSKLCICVEMHKKKSNIFTQKKSWK